jgi:hypothetical protein
MNVFILFYFNVCPEMIVFETTSSLTILLSSSSLPPPPKKYSLNICYNNMSLPWALVLQP